jgi:hypothetical protein
VEFLLSEMNPFFVINGREETGDQNALQESQRKRPGGVLSWKKIRPAFYI